MTRMPWAAELRRYPISFAVAAGQVLPYAEECAIEPGVLPVPRRVAEDHAGWHRCGRSSAVPPARAWLSDQSALGLVGHADSRSAPRWTRDATSARFRSHGRREGRVDRPPWAASRRKRSLIAQRSPRLPCWPRSRSACAIRLVISDVICARTTSGGPATRMPRIVATRS